jgi:hypothetical protein
MTKLEGGWRFMAFFALISLGLASPSHAQLVIVAANTSNTGQDGNGNLLAAGAADPSWQLVGYDNSYGFTPAYVAANPSYGDVAISYGPNSTSSNSVPYATVTMTPTYSSGLFVTENQSSYVVENAPGAWASYPGEAQFVAATQNQAVGGMPGTFVYQFSFTSPVTGLVTFSGNASADNGLKIVYDGTTEATFGGQLVLSTTPGWTPGLSTNGGSNAAIPAGGSVYGQNAVPFSYTAPVSAGVNTIDFYVSNFDDAAYSGDEEGLVVTDFAVVVPEPGKSATLFLIAGLGLLLIRQFRRMRLA